MNGAGPSPLAFWSRSLVWVHAGLIVVCSLVLSWAFAIMVFDHVHRGEDWDGLGMLVGLETGRLVLPMLMVLVALTVGLRRARRSGRPIEIVDSALSAGFVALLWIGWTLVFARPLSEPVLWGWILVPGAVLLLASCIVIAVALTKKPHDPQTPEHGSG